MIIYKVPTRENFPVDDSHTGYFWTLSKREAVKVFKEKNANEDREDKIEELELSMNRHDLIDFLNTHCSFPDNG